MFTRLHRANIRYRNKLSLNVLLENKQFFYHFKNAKCANTGEKIGRVEDTYFCSFLTFFCTIWYLMKEFLFISHIKFSKITSFEELYSNM